jgi:uncharacterized protein
MSPIDLHEWARRNAVWEVKDAIAKGLNLNAKDAFGCTPLHCAIAGRSVETALLLLEHGADLRAQDNNGSTALHYAIAHGLPRVAEELLKHDPAMIGISDKHGNEPLWTAAFNSKGDYSLVSMLKRYGADPRHDNNVNLSPVDIAKRKGDETLLRILESAIVR